MRHQFVVLVSVFFLLAMGVKNFKVICNNKTTVWLIDYDNVNFISRV